MGDKRGNESEKGIVLQGGWMGDAKIRLLAAISELSRGEVAKAAELVVDTAGLIKFHMDKATQIPGIHVNTRSGFLVIGNTSRPPLPRPTFKPAAKPAAPAEFGGGQPVKETREPAAIEPEADIDIPGKCPNCGGGPITLNAPETIVCKGCGAVNPRPDVSSVGELDAQADAEDFEESDDKFAPE
jgi:hypothetical protein